MLSFSLQNFQRLSHKQTQIYGESDAALRWLEGFIDSTVLDHPAPVLDRQSVQLLQLSRKRRQRLSQLHPFRDELLDQIRPSSDERRSRPVAATLLLHCFVVSAGLSSCGEHYAQLSGTV